MQNRQTLGQLGLAEALVEQLERALVAGMRLRHGAEAVQPREQGVALPLDVIVASAEIVARRGAAALLAEGLLTEGLPDKDLRSAIPINFNRGLVVSAPRVLSRMTMPKSRPGVCGKAGRVNVT